jgi:hypothetical protein
MKKIILVVVCLSLLVIFSPEHGYCSDEAIFECVEQILQKYPNVEAIKKQFGDQAKWQRETEPSPHDPDLELIINNMESPGIEIRTMGYSWEDEDSFFITLLDVKKEGCVEFHGIDIGSNRDDVIKTFGKPYTTEGNKLHYEDSDMGNIAIEFILIENKVAEMILRTFVD